MKSIKCFPFVLLFIFTFACTSEKSTTSDEKVRFDRAFQAMAYLDTMKIDRPLLVSYILASNDDFLFSLTDKSDPLVRVFDHRTGKYLGGFGKNGGGPGEFERVNRSGFSIDYDNITVTSLKHIRSYKVTREVGKLKSVLRREGRIPGELSPLNYAFFLNDSIVAGKKMLSNSLFSSFNVNSGLVSGYGEYPDWKPEIPDASYHHLYQSQSRIRPDRKKLAMVFSNFPILRIIDTQMESFQDVEIRPENEQKAIEAAADGRSIKSFELYKYFNRIEVNKSFILAKYGERELVPKSPGSREWVSNQLVDEKIMVFDWEGQPIVQLQVEEWMNQFTITPDNRVIFFHPEMKDELYVIDLKKLID